MARRGASWMAESVAPSLRAWWMRGRRVTLVPLAVTTSTKVDAALVREARAVAARWGVPFLPRRAKESVAPWLGTKAAALLVVGGDGVTLWDAEGSFGFHAGMAHLRRMRLRAGEPDAFVRVAELRAGDAVLDCTLGLAQDAMVASLAVGPSGRVVGLERSLALGAVAGEGLRRYALGEDSGPIEVVHADAREYLKTLPSRAFDVVFFDPMFAKPRKSQPAFDMLRRFAEHAPLTQETLEEARRVARRWVVVKGAKYTDDLRKLGLEDEPGSRFTDVIWGRVGPSAEP
ncbi:class I SAM-dependent methyltransferase [Myxococcus sp. MxC21-1]|uniref:class I SAM-dependent methyltransferase n=2 Tax=unclassified Myxococcus TaxID=2648731 RepID=UPI00292E269B|nr:class I SAM-dependent methyltransferase [Myxococcus sp. MxC21-1]WNZ65654.1 class I SAM-dependent methyltransferase [Myxococcus sp. MxC21-1]